MPNIATEIRPLNELLEKEIKWVWNERCNRACLIVKNMLTADVVLTHYDANLPVQLGCDASPYRLRSVLSHVMTDGTERSVLFASRALTKSERNYVQIAKEAFGIVWSGKQLYTYLFGRSFTLVTDHHPLTSIFSPNKGIPITTATRLQRIALFLSGFNYQMEYKNPKRHNNADSLSRLPLAEPDRQDTIDGEDVFHVSQIEHLHVTSDIIQRESRRDNVLARLHDHVTNGWKDTDTHEVIKPLYGPRTEITLYQRCLLWAYVSWCPSNFANKS